MDLRRIRKALLFLSLSAAGFVTATAQIPTPVSVLGHNPGDDYYLADYDDAIRYFHALAASSNRIKMFKVGKTTRGEEFEIAVISSPENLARLDEYKANSRKLADSRGLTDTQAHELARNSKIIVHIDGGLHSNEVAGGQHSIQLAYKLVSAQNDPEIDSILNNVILVLWPTINPDGQNMVAHWYRKNLGTQYEVSPMPELFQEYVGHDNNRDGYMQNMLESQVVTRVEMEYSPAIFYCQHQTAPFPARIWIPPFADPISSNISPYMRSWLNVIGVNMSAALQEQHMPGAISQTRFDNWYPGFLDFTHVFRNEISFFTETALYRYATPRFYTVDEFPAEYQDLKALTLYTDPWQGGWWRLGDAVRYMIAGSMSVLDTASKYHEQLLYNRWQAAHDNIQHYSSNAPYAYVLPNPQADTPEAALLAQKMLDNGIEVHRAAKEFEANGVKYPAGSWVILMDQPFSGLVRELFEAQHYPQAILDGNAKPVDLPYDVTGWTLPMQMGVKVDAVTDPVEDAQRANLERVNRIETPKSAVEGAGPVYALSHKPNASFEAVNDILAAGGNVGFSREAVDTSEGPELGAFLVSGIGHASLLPIVEKYGLVATSVRGGESLPIHKARVGLYRPWQPSIDEGWTRWILEKYGFAPESIYNAGMKAGNLRARYDTIILPDLTKSQLLDGFKPGIVPSEYAGGIDSEGVSALRNFVQQGGNLIAFNQTSSALIDLLGLPVRNILAGLKSDQFFCSGALLQVDLKDLPSRPALYGLKKDPIVMFEKGPAFAPAPGFEGEILASYPKTNPLESGVLIHPDKIEGMAAAVELAYGKGHIFLYGFKPQWRGQSHGSYKFFMNELYRFDEPAIQRLPEVKISANLPNIPASAGQDDDDDGRR
ncbi:M14 family zinc carboxypeptidase [Silvibacterium acidisoli]|uniref:M14 family zinc carboxypeptidase n=1 Tax=Acidobacteriaceae bacterium ZG23-2 TaxID=2883246 RepID=UPI00406C9EDD